MKKLDFYFKKKTTDEEEMCTETTCSSPVEADTGDPGPGTSSQDDVAAKKGTSLTFAPPYPDMALLKEDDLSKHKIKVDLLNNEWEPNSYANYAFPSR